MGAKSKWKRPLTYLLVPVAILLAFIGILAPFPPPRPTKPGQERSTPAKESE